MSWFDRFLDRHPWVETALNYLTAVVIGLSLATLLFFQLSK